jgi:hypothetical protein
MVVQCPASVSIHITHLLQPSKPSAFLALAQQPVDTISGGGDCKPGKEQYQMKCGVLYTHPQRPCPIDRHIDPMNCFGKD